jgi:hypothetical protein
MLGLNPELLRHGINREVFICKLADNAEDYLRGDSKKLHYTNLLSVNDVGNLAIERWIVPRAARRPEFKSWKSSMILDMLDPRKDGSASLSVMSPAPNLKLEHFPNTIQHPAFVHNESDKEVGDILRLQREVHVPRS